MHDISQVKPEPFLKWAGGKRNLLSFIDPYLPHDKSSFTYFEPFLGGGAVFYHLDPPSAVLSDLNEELIETYVAVRDDVDAVIDHLSMLSYSESVYYQVRASRPTSITERAARFIYLNKTCFNGLYRVNLRGEFNVPFGRHGANIEVCNTKQLEAASFALKRASLCVGDFSHVLDRAAAGDFVYFDPPYTTAHTNNGFIEYNARVFSWDDQHRLATVADQLVEKGVSVVISNADHPAIIDCYTRSGKLSTVRLERWSTIAGKAPKRARVTELLLVGGIASGEHK